MARFVFKLPDIGEGIAEAEIVAWHVAVGDRVSEDQPIADLMTDKATVEMESPVAGTVIELAGEPGDQLAIGSTLIVIETEEADGAEESDQPVEAVTENHRPDEDVEPWVAREGASHPGEDESGAGAADSSPSPAVPGDYPLPPSPPHRQSVQASPSVRERARKLGIDLAQVQAATPHRVRHPDLDAYILYNAGLGFGPSGGTRADEEVKVIGLRRRIAENMAAAKRHIPHFTYVEEIDVTELERMRAELNAERGRRPKLTMLPLLIRAICRALPDYPMINARYDDEAGIVTRHGAVHLGMATQTDGGLMVPVIRNAHLQNLWQLAAEILRLAHAAREGTIKKEELSGSTLTITSLGPLGGIASTPVINRPEVAIIGPNRIVERPVFAKNDLGGTEIRLAKLMNLSISCDHRVVDGWDAASFVQALKKLIETPVLLFTE